MPAARPDRRTARGLQDGRQEAVSLPGRFEYFYLQEYPKVVALVYVLLGSRAGAEDIAQEAFLRAYRDWERVGSYEHQAAWVRRVGPTGTSGPAAAGSLEARALTRLLVAGTDRGSLAAGDAEFWARWRALPRRQAQAVGAVLLSRSVDPVRPRRCWLHRGGRSGASRQGPTDSAPPAAT